MPANPAEQGAERTRTAVPAQRANPEGSVHHDTRAEDFARRYMRDEDYPDGPEGCPLDSNVGSDRRSRLWVARGFVFACVFGVISFASPLEWWQGMGVTACLIPLALWSLAFLNGGRL